MHFDKDRLRLYAVTDRSWLHGQTLRTQVEAALQGGVTCVQLREKQLDRERASSIWGGPSGVSAAVRRAADHQR